MNQTKIICDKVSKEDFENLNFIYCCQQCSHFDDLRSKCTMGFDSRPHLKDAQLKRYQETSEIAFCRFLEID